MTRINCLLSDDLPVGRLVQLVVGILDPTAHRIELLSAGHGPLFLYSADGDRIDDFNAHGPPQSIEMKPGDTLVLITDGFFEWNNPAGEEYGLDRIRAVLREVRDTPSREIIGRLRASVEAFAAGTPQEDDLTAVVVKRIAPAV